MHVRACVHACAHVCAYVFMSLEVFVVGTVRRPREVGIFQDVAMDKFFEALVLYREAQPLMASQTGQDETGQDGTGRDGTGQDKTGQDRTGPDRKG